MDRKPSLIKGVKHEEEKKMTSGEENSSATTTPAAVPSADSKTRVLVGVMRVGLLAKQLLLRQAVDAFYFRTDHLQSCFPFSFSMLNCLPSKGQIRLKNRNQ